MIQLEILNLVETEESAETYKKFQMLGIEKETEVSFKMMSYFRFIDLKQVSSITIEGVLIGDKEYKMPVISLISGEEYLVNHPQAELLEQINIAKEYNPKTIVFSRIIE